MILHVSCKHSGVIINLQFVSCVQMQFKDQGMARQADVNE